MKTKVLFILSFLLIVNACLGQSTQCKGITQKGERCKRMTTNSNGYCYQHQGQVPKNTEQEKNVAPSKSQTKSTPVVKSSGYNGQCKGITKSGQRCKHTTSNSNGYCYQHQDQAPKTENKSNVETTGSKVNQNSQTGTTKEMYNGHEVHTGSKGGKYYINSNGNKTYIKK